MTTFRVQMRAIPICTGVKTIPLYLFSYSHAWHNHPAMIVTLSETQTWSAVVGPEGILVRVVAGEVWITREGDREDHVVAAPRAFQSTGRGRLAVQALGPARLEVSPLVSGVLLEVHPIPATPR